MAKKATGSSKKSKTSAAKSKTSAKGTKTSTKGTKTSTKTKNKTSAAKSTKSAASQKNKKNISTPQYKPTEQERVNGDKVLAILENIEDIGYNIDREDLFTVVEPEFGLEITLDAEETVICLIAEICDQEHLNGNLPNWQEELLKLNNGLLHGAFTLFNDKVYLRENLAAENLDANELEDALSAMFAGIITSASRLKLM